MLALLGTSMTVSFVGTSFAATAAVAASAQTPPAKNRYSDQMFTDAVNNRETTSPPFVLVTIVDGSTGKEKTGCTEVSALAAAISLQKGWTRDNPRPDDEEVNEMLENTPGRRFVFLQTRWLAGSGYYAMERNEKACALLRHGIPAFRADLTGQTVAGTPGHALGPTTPGE